MSKDATESEGSNRWPESCSNALAAEAQRRFAENTHHGGWENDEARWHLYKAHDELSSATHHAKMGKKTEMLERMADAYNHMLFAFDIMDR